MPEHLVVLVVDCAEDELNDVLSELGGVLGVTNCLAATPQQARAIRRAVEW